MYVILIIKNIFKVLVNNNSTAYKRPNDLTIIWLCELLTPFCVFISAVKLVGETSETEFTLNTTESPLNHSSNERATAEHPVSASINEPVTLYQAHFI